VPRELQACALAIVAVAVAAFVSLCLSYGRLVRSVEFAAGSAGVSDG
jgi:hypothetical protein